MSVRDRPAFLVVEPDVLIAHDLRETLEGFDPRAVIHVARDAEGARAALEELDRLTAAFLRLPSLEPRSDEIPDAVERLGGRVVILDGDDGAATATGDRPDRIYTGRPYGSDAIAAALRRIGLAPGLAADAPAAGD